MIDSQIISPTEARSNFFNLLNTIVENNQVYIVNRRNGENVALIPESDLVSLVETVYLLRNSANANRLFDAIEESESGKIQPQSISELQQELGIEQEKEETEG